MRFPLGDAEREQLEREYAQLMQDHRDLDAAIEALKQIGSSDQLQIQRLKKRKLLIKDQMTVITDRLQPDIIA
jgi:hypothetical protein